MTFPVRDRSELTGLRYSGCSCVIGGGLSSNAEPFGGTAAPALRAMAAFLWHTAQLEEVILFGSRARGTEHDGSDADFLIVLTLNTSRQARDALAQQVLAFNQASAIELERFDMTGLELCEALRRGSPPFATRAMEEGIMFLPVERGVSRYSNFARAWRLANRLKLYMSPARHQLAEARMLLSAGYPARVEKYIAGSVDDALRSLLIFAGGDYPKSERPADVVREVETFKAGLGQPLLQHQAALGRLSRVPGASGLTADELLALAEAVIGYVEATIGVALEPNIPCPAR